MVRTRRKPADPNQPPRAIIYTRLSKAKGGNGRADADKNTEASLETQEATCKALIAAMNGVVIGAEHDVAAGDRIDNRHGLFRALERIRNGEADTLIIHSLDRLSRDTMQQASIMHQVRQVGGRLLSATEPNFEQGPIGDAMSILLGVASSMELARIRERVNRSLDAKFRQQRRYKPAQRPPYGYRRQGTGPDAVYQVDPLESEIVRRIFAERAAGESIRQIILRLREDGIPTPLGRGEWHTHSVQSILERDVYWNGQHEVWRTKTERDVDNVPYLEPRPAEERYTVAFPPFVDPAVAEQARKTAPRNRWRSQRNDRPGKHGIGRYGYFLCGQCGRAMVVVNRKVGHARYACTQHRHLSRPCPKPVSITVEKLDLPVWYWVQSVMEDPTRADAWKPELVQPEFDADAFEALTEAHEQIDRMEADIAARLENVSHLSGRVRDIALANINDLNAELDAAIAAKDALAAKVAKSMGQPKSMVVAQDAIANATVRALEAMKATDPNPAVTHSIDVTHADGFVSTVVPDTWDAKQAALSVLGVKVWLFPEDAEGPRWVAEMHLPGGVALHGEDDGKGWFTPDPISEHWREDSSYLFPTRRCSG